MQKKANSNQIQKQHSESWSVRLIFELPKPFTVALATNTSLRSMKILGIANTTHVRSWQMALQSHHTRCAPSVGTPQIGAVPVTCHGITEVSTLWINRSSSPLTSPHNAQTLTAIVVAAWSASSRTRPFMLWMVRWCCITVTIRIVYMEIGFIHHSEHAITCFAWGVLMQTITIRPCQDCQLVQSLASVHAMTKRNSRSTLVIPTSISG